MAPKRQKTIEEQYMKLSQLDHILLRPDSYVGSIEGHKEWLWIHDGKALTYKEVNYVPGMYKIFDEIIVNAADNFERDPEHQTYIKVELDEKEGRISIENNGQSLPVEMHQEHKMYVPELVFGHLLTSDNYDDGEKKVTGGRNGYGAKLTNIFSTKFEVECGDSARQKKFFQTWEDNMRKKDKPKISAYKGDNFTKITFYPDFAKFGMKKLDKDILGLLSRRCYDIAGTTPRRCKMYLNKHVVDIKDFKDYVDKYVSAEDGGQIVVHEKVHDRWEFAMTVSDGQFQQVSFVNRIATPKGGTHITHVADQLVEAIAKRVNSKNKGGMDIKPYHVRNYLWLFINCQVENPSFDSQTKENMTLKPAKFGSKCEISDAVINKVLKTGIVDTILQWAKAKEAIDLGKTMKAGGKQKAKRLLNIPKLEDANLAGSRDGPECTLILTEGDSAKSLAVAGLSVIGRDRYGVFPLRGKLLNVRDASFAATMGNAEIANITKILGIEPKKQYNSTQGMRYGHLMVMADQDYDGSHIKGLILNLVQHWWPSLFKLPGFMMEFVTPIVKATRRGNSQTFFTMHEYEQWKDQTNNGKGWSIKYYKGLGTSTTMEAKEYFRALDAHSLSFEYTGEEGDEKIDLAFNKKRADDRKDWINAADDDSFVDHSQASVTYTDFVAKELVQFAKYDVMRSIPCVVDGFKPVQRKVMWSAFKRNLKNDIKVAQFAGYVSEQASYHHGEASLQGTIIALAQNFVGSNNVNLLFPSGQFGTRLQGGKDAASSRYIYTRLEKAARLIFHPHDDKILEYQNEEGQWIEPRWYIPVIPMLLVNGADGIGTGWSTFLPNYSPRDIIANIKRWIRCEPMEELCPWYRGFSGSILPAADKESWELLGVIEKRGPTTLEITELPVRKWTQDYKEFLQGMLPTEGAGSGQIEDFKEYHTEVTVHFVITVTEAQMANFEKNGFEKSFKLRSPLSTSNMVFFDKDGKIKKYNTELEIMEDFLTLRLEMYKVRKAHLLRVLRQQYEILAAKVRFIQLVIDEKLKVKNRKKDALIEDLKKNKFRTMQEITGGDDLDMADGDEPSGGAENKKGGWDYLLGMPLWSLTNERILDLEEQLKKKRDEMKNLEAKAPEELWESDLDAILEELTEIEARAGRSAAEEKKMRASAMKRQASLSLMGRGKRPRVSAPEASLPPTPQAFNTGPGSDSRSLQEMQERVLQRTVAEFPGLFDDIVPPPPPTQGSGGAQDKSRKPSTRALGNFARKLGGGKGRGRGRGHGNDGNQDQGGQAEPAEEDTDESPKKRKL